MEYGLTKIEISGIIEILRKFHEIETVYIYGSRAKGNFKNASDIDLAFSIDGDRNLVSALRLALEDAPTIHRIEIMQEDEIPQGKFRSEYLKTRKIFYERNKI